MAFNSVSNIDFSNVAKTQIQQQQTIPSDNSQNEFLKHEEPVLINKNNIISEFQGTTLTGKRLNFAVDILTELRTDKENSDISAQDVEDFVIKNYQTKDQ